MNPIVQIFAEGIITFLEKEFTKASPELQALLMEEIKMLSVELMKWIEQKTQKGA